MRIKTCLYFIFSFFISLVIGNTYAQEKGSATMNKNNQRISSYKNISTSPSYLKFRFKNDVTGEVINVIFDNNVLAHALAGVYYKNSIFSPPAIQMPDDFNDFINSVYLNFLLNKEGGEEIVTLSDFPRNLKSKKPFADENLLKLILANSYTKELSLDLLNVKSKDELIAEYFDCNKNVCSLKKEYYSEFNLNKAFIGLLLDKGYEVLRGDIVPTLMVRCNTQDNK